MHLRAMVRLTAHGMIADRDTIVAPATGSGGTAIAVIRLSGPACRFVTETIAGALPPARRMALRSLHDPHGTILDQGLVVWFPGPNTFTGEDLAEFHIHGGRATVSGVIQAILGLGARMAEPGEFTRRAVLNGRMDLTEAEALGDLIAAETEAQRRQALRQMEGALGQQADRWRGELLDILALIEADLDFSDESDVPDLLPEPLRQRLAALARDLENCLQDNRRGERLRDGYTIVIAGPPNAGKSTLLNAIARRDIAIVSEVAGTTRDALETRVDLRGLPVTFVDTAGIRETHDPIEQEGVKRSRRHIDQADLVLWLSPVDSVTEWTDDTRNNALCVLTKCDLGERDLGERDLGTNSTNVPEGAPKNPFSVSAHTGQGLDQLLDSIAERLTELQPGNALITRERHRHAIEQCLTHVREAIDLSSGPAVTKPLDLLAEDVRLAARAMGMVTGRVGAEDVLDRIFSSFCIGK